jgi:hypothetical protein
VPIEHGIVNVIPPGAVKRQVIRIPGQLPKRSVVKRVYHETVLLGYCSGQAEPRVVIGSQIKIGKKSVRDEETDKDLQRITHSCTLTDKIKQDKNK